MAVLFFDTSAIVKRYVREIGTSWIISQLRQPATDVFIANLTGIETAAVTRRKNNGSLAIAAADKALRRFRRDFANRYIVVELSAAMVALGMQLAEKHGLRNYDAAQLAVAVSLHCRLASSGVTLFSFARKQPTQSCSNRKLGCRKPE